MAKGVKATKGAKMKAAKGARGAKAAKATANAAVNDEVAVATPSDASGDVDGSATSAAGKRKWVEVDWDIVMEAQSYVAVFADPFQDVVDMDADKEAAPVKKTPAKRGRKSKKVKAEEAAAAAAAKKKKKDTKTKTAAKATTSTRATRSRAMKSVDNDDQQADDEKQADDDKAVASVDTAVDASATESTDEFWLAQLLDDVTADMLDDEDAQVHVMWLNRVGGSDAAATKKHRYEYAYDDVVTVQSILCHVYLIELSDVLLELTPKSLKRIERNIARTKSGDVAADGDDDDLHERPPTSRMKERALAASSRGSRGRASSGSGGGSGAATKLSKRDEALIVPPLYTTVDADQYVDDELFGPQGFTDWKKDTFAMNREVLRAVLTANHKLLKKLTTDKHVYSRISSFTTAQSADMAVSPLQLAIERDDIAAARLLLQARELTVAVLAKPPTVSLPSHSTGKHTSAFSDYNRRAINASRGGKEGNKALVEDTSGSKIDAASENVHLWHCATASTAMLTLMHPTGEWVTDYSTSYNIGHAARLGNYKFVAKVVETLLKNGGYGFNELHVRVLSDSDDELPPFRAVSVIKMASQSRVRPIHLAAINPNAKYLEALFDSAGTDAAEAKDSNGYEAIHYAAACEGTAPLEFLLERNVSLAARSKSRETPMMRALMARREDNAIVMLEHAARSSDDASALEKLVTERGTASKQPIHLACEHGCARVVAKLLELGADANAPASDKMTPLCIAAQKGHVACVDALLAGGAKVNTGDKLKKTPLIYAVKNGHTKVAALLINHGANVNAYDTSENSVVHYAASYGWRSCLALLADAGADFWVRNSWGFVPLICALLQRRLSASEFILEHDETQRFLDFRDRQGCTMLFLQCKHSSDVSQIQYLLEKGLQPDICDSEREYPLQRLLARAAKSRDAGTYIESTEIAAFFDDSIRLLLTHGAKPQYTIERRPLVADDAASDDGANDDDDDKAPARWQPLQLAMCGGLDRIFDTLLDEFDADPSATAADGSDAWLTAAALGSRGDRYMKAMLKHCAKAHKSSSATAPTPLVFAARAGHQFKDNLFHVIARTGATGTLDPALVRECLDACGAATATQMLHEKDSDGYSPVLALLQHERKINWTVNGTTDAERSDRIAADRLSDATYSELVALFAERTTSADAFTRFVSKRSAKHELVAPDAATSATNVPFGTAAFGSDDDSDADADDDDGDDDDGSNSDNSDSDNSNASETASDRKNKARKAAAAARTASEDAAAGDDSTSAALVLFETALHLAANRKLSTNAVDAARTWHGRNLVALLVDVNTRVFDTALVNVPDLAHHKTALQFAVEANDVETVRVLVEHGADPNHSPFRCDACKTAQLSDSSSNDGPSPQCDVKCGTERIETALFAAVKRANAAITALLLTHGADVACYEHKTRNTPLHCALEANSAEITKALLAHGADLSLRNARGQAPLHFAVHAKHSVPATELHQDEVQYTDLNKAGIKTITKASTTATKTLSAIQVALQDAKAAAAVVLADSASLTPIHLAAANRDLALLHDLVRACTDKTKAMNVRDDLGRTPLHYAVNRATMSPDASFEVERFLLQSGADANAADAFGFTALHLALLKVDFDWHKQYDAAQTATPTLAAQTQQDRDDGKYDAKRQRAFFAAIGAIPSSETDPVETVSNLAAVRGINVAAQDALGRSPLHLAAATGAFVCVSMLLSACRSDAARTALLALEDNASFTALGQGVLHLRQTTIMTLLQHKADVRGKIRITTPLPTSNSTDESSEAAVKTRQCSYFYHAVKHSLSGICHMLLTAKFCLRQAIEDAVRCGQFQLAYNLVIGTDVANDATLLTRLNDRSETLLHALAKVPNKPFDKLARTIAWTLVDAGVRVRAQNADGHTALHYAAKHASIHVMDFLLHNGADVNVKNSAGETPLVFAIKRSKALSYSKVVAVLKYLVGKPGVDLHAKDTTGMNVLTAFIDRFADTQADRAHFVWIETLLKKGVDPNGRFTTRASRELFANKALADSSAATKMPALVRMVYATPPTGRYHTIALLLRYSAKVTTVDTNGHSVITHLAAKNLLRELKLVLGVTKRVVDATAEDTNVLKPLHVPPADVKAALALSSTRLKQTALHFAVRPFAFESYENPDVVRVLLDAGANLHAKDAAGRSALDYTRDQASRFLFRFLKTTYPSLVMTTEATFFGAATDDNEPMFEAAPDFVADARAYLAECERSGKIRRDVVEPEVNANCDVGKVSHVYSKLDAATGDRVRGEEYSALLTKVDVKNGRFGLNVFYRLQVVHDELQGLYVVFTNWGRIGETGKFQNTPFRVAADAVTEFKKIFRSKTTNHWDDRTAFTKKPGKYNLVQRVTTRTRIDKSVTATFTEVEHDVVATTPPPRYPAFSEPSRFPPSVVALLSAITDIRNLELAATESCDYRDSLPLASRDELDAALAKLRAMRSVIEARDVVSKQLAEASGALTDDGTAKLTALSDEYAALTETISEASSRYYEVMPVTEDASFGGAIKAFDSVKSVNAEITRLRLLVDIVVAYQMLLGAKRLQETVHPFEYCFNAMQVTLAPLAADAQETQLLTRYFFNGLRPHTRASYRVANVFAVDRRGETQRFRAFQQANPHAVAHQHAQLLWHGTRRTNLMGILSQGLRIAPPEAPHHGYMYGKGLYFADVTAKSVDYCGAPYKLMGSTTRPTDGDKDSRKARTVFYMLLCEVATGDAMQLEAPTFEAPTTTGADGSTTPRCSVHALSKFVPNPVGAVVSPASGAKLHLGAVGEVGSAAVPIDTMWATTDYSPSPTTWYECRRVFTAATRRLLSHAIETLSVGDSHTVDATDREHFMDYVTYSTRTVSIELVSRSISSPADADSGGDTGTYCDATVKVVYTDANDVASTYSYVAKRFRNFCYGTPMAKGFALQPQTLADYSEFIVYNEAQARIRYLLEVEHV